MSIGSGRHTGNGADASAQASLMAAAVNGADAPVTIAHPRLRVHLVFGCARLVADHVGEQRFSFVLSFSNIHQSKNTV